MKKAILFFLLLVSLKVSAQTTLQTVTTNGNVTTDDLIVRDAGDTTTYGQGIDIRSDASQTTLDFLRIKPFDQTHTQLADFTNWLVYGNQPGGVTADPNWVWGSGFNQSSGGGRENSSLPAIFDRVEYNWHISNANRQFEKYTTLIFEDGTYVRPYMFYSQEANHNLRHEWVGAIDISRGSNNDAYCGITGGSGNTELSLISTASTNGTPPSTSASMNIIITDNAGQINTSDQIPLSFQTWSAMNIGSHVTWHDLQTSSPYLRINAGNVEVGEGQIYTIGQIESGTFLKSGSYAEIGTLLKPTTDNAVDVGVASTKRFKDMYLSGNGNMNKLLLTSSSSNSIISYGTLTHVASPTVAGGSGALISFNDVATNHYGMGIDGSGRLWSQVGNSNGGGFDWLKGTTSLMDLNSSGVLTVTGNAIVPDNAYNSTSWNGNLEVPTKNAVRDQIEAVISATAPSSGSANYIQNQNASTQTANFKISGNADCNNIHTLGSATIDGSAAVGGSINASVDITASGDMYAVNFINTSDKRYKKNIEELSSVSSELFKISAFQYDYVKGVNNKKFDDKKHFGFIAQEVEKVFPEMVRKDGNGYYGVNYTEFIPLLLQAMKEQDEQSNSDITKLQNQIDLLKSEINSCCQANTSKTTGFQDTKQELQVSTLAQNIPNPTSGETVIGFNIVGDFGRAFMGVYDLNGREIKRISISKGMKDVRIEKGQLSSGQYVYSLIVDNNLIDSKKMLVIEQ